MKASEVLRNGLKRLDGGEKWRKGSAGEKWRDCDNCAATAIADNSRSCEEAAEGYFLRSIYLSPEDRFPAIYRWNDAPERTFADVEAAFQKAIQLAEAEGN